MAPGAGAPMQKSELAAYYFIALAVLLIIFIAQIIKMIYDIIKKTPNQTPQIINNGKNLLVLILLIIVVGLLPNEWGISILKALVESLK